MCIFLYESNSLHALLTLFLSAAAPCAITKHAYEEFIHKPLSKLHKMLKNYTGTLIVK